MPPQEPGEGRQELFLLFLQLFHNLEIISSQKVLAKVPCWLRCEEWTRGRPVGDLSWMWLRTRWGREKGGGGGEATLSCGQSQPEWSADSEGPCGSWGPVMWQVLRQGQGASLLPTPTSPFLPFFPHPW